jgi:ubiquinone/menaquinone biosynthesis C-methylase UbiE
LDAAGIRNGETVLEVAVGTGIMFVEILKLNPDGVSEGVDITREMLALAQRKAAAVRAGGYKLTQGDAYELEYPDCRFDVLINNFMFDLLPEADFAAVLGEFRRVLRPGGRLVLANMTVPRHWHQGLWELLYRLSPALMGGCRGVELLHYVEAAGFQEAQRDFVSQLTFPCEIVHGVRP